MVKLSVPPTAQPLAVKSNKPCGNTMPGPGVVGGTGSAPGGAAMNCGEKRAQDDPPPVKQALTLPLPVAEGAV